MKWRRIVADLAALLPRAEARALPGAGWHLTVPAMAQVCEALRAQVNEGMPSAIRGRIVAALGDLADFFGEGYVRMARKRRGKR